jgi:diaminopimelate decarboxylase
MTWKPWLGPRRAEELAQRFGTPFYVYSARTIRSRCRAISRAFPGASVRYAMKANSNPSLLALIRSMGVGADTVSPWEVRLARAVGFRRKDTIYSGNNPSDDDLKHVHDAGVVLNLDALSSLRRFGELAPGGEVSLRLNLEIGAGHHPHVITAGADSKFGLSVDELPEARAVAQKHGLRIVGLHQHIGSGILEPKLFLDAMEPLLGLLGDFADLEFVDVGGGFGIPYKPDEQAVDLEGWGNAVMGRFEQAIGDLGRPLRLIIEPGRYLVAEAGLLVARVTTLKRTRDRLFVGVDSGMHHLIRPALYQSYHPVVTYPAREAPPERCFVVGPICESGDVLAEERMIAPPEEGDLVVIGHAGAYGYTMSSHYNLRARPAEVLVDGPEVATLIREREHFRDAVHKRDLRLAECRFRTR